MVARKTDVYSGYVTSSYLPRLGIYNEMAGRESGGVERGEDTRLVKLLRYMNAMRKQPFKGQRYGRHCTFKMQTTNQGAAIEE